MAASSAPDPHPSNSPENHARHVNHPILWDEVSISTTLSKILLSSQQNVTDYAT